MGRAKVDPIHIAMKEDLTPVAQGKRPIPIQFKDTVQKKLEDMKANGLIEGPAAAEGVHWVDPQHGHHEEELEFR